jgi:hypothetical protein
MVTFPEKHTAYLTFSLNLHLTDKVSPEINTGAIVVIDMNINRTLSQ